MTYSPTDVKLWHVDPSRNIWIFAKENQDSVELRAGDTSKFPSQKAAEPFFFEQWYDQACYVGVTIASYMRFLRCGRPAQPALASKLLASMRAHTSWWSWADKRDWCRWKRFFGEIMAFSNRRMQLFKPYGSISKSRVSVSRTEVVTLIRTVDDFWKSLWKASFR